MLRIGDILVSHGLITNAQLEDALFAQRQFGGRVGTNLVELGYVSDDQLAGCLSEQLGVPYVKPEALTAIPREVVARIPRAKAEKYRVVPLRFQANELHVAIADPQNFAQLDELAFTLGARLRPYVVTEVALNYALERYYGVPRDVRMMQAVTAGLRELHATPTPAPHIIAATDLESLPVFDTAAAVQVTPVVDELAAVMSEPDVLRALFRYFTDLFAEVVILAVADGRVVPALAGNRTRAREPRSAVTLTATEGSLLRVVMSRPQIIHQPQVVDPEVIRLCTAYGLSASNVAFVSIFNGEKPAYAVIGQGRDEAYLMQSFAGLRGFVGKAALALRIVTLRKEIRAA
jgi:hypothetical protein